jgi:ribosomal protein L9
MEIENAYLFWISQTGKISDYYNIPEGYWSNLFLPIKIATVENVGLLLTFFQREREYKFYRRNKRNTRFF